MQINAQETEGFLITDAWNPETVDVIKSTRNASKDDFTQSLYVLSKFLEARISTHLDTKVFRRLSFA